jgi:hypothetical protein
LSRIEKWAFRGSGLIEINTASSIELLGDDRFGGCKKLQSIQFETTPRLQFVGRDVFKQVPVRPILPKRNSE